METNLMKSYVQVVAIIAFSLTGLAAIYIAHTAIVTQYNGSFDVEVGPNGGRLRVAGRSDPAPSLPPAD
jgi:hypothetical protein